MKKLLVFIMFFAVASLASAEIMSPMQIVDLHGTFGIELPNGCGGTGGRDPQVGDGLGGYWVLIGVSPTSGAIKDALPKMSLSAVYGDASMSGLFVPGIGVLGEFTIPAVTPWTHTPGLYANGFTVLPGWSLGLYLFKLDDAVTEATLIDGLGLPCPPPPSWFFVPEPATMALLGLGSMMISRRRKA